MPAYYNEIEPFAAQWLRNLIAAGHLPPGDVDERSILDVQPEDLRPYEQCHFFAGIGVWPYALRGIGWPDNRRIWTGSCPCQPFSSAGRQAGFTDERHLWPAWYHLITQCGPTVVAGEQVSSAGAWLDLVSDDLEGAGYAVGAADLCAAGFPLENWRESPQHEWLLRALYDCPDPLVAAELLDFAAWASGNLGAHDGDHIRSRWYFVGVADGEGEGRSGREFPGTFAEEKGSGARLLGTSGHGPISRVGHASSDGNREHARELRSDEGQYEIGASNRLYPPVATGAASGVADSNSGERYGIANGQGGERHGASGGWVESYGGARARGALSGVEHGEQPGLERLAGHGDGGNEPRRVHAQPHRPAAAAGDASGLESGAGERLERGLVAGGELQSEPGRLFPAGSNHHANGAAGHAPNGRRGATDWIFCRDGKWRPVGSGTFPLANAPASRVGRLRAYGNALDGETVKAFLGAVRDCLP